MGAQGAEKRARPEPAAGRVRQARSDPPRLPAPLVTTSAPSSPAAVPRTAAHLLPLQRTLGNQAVARLVQAERMLQRDEISGNPQDLQNAAGQQTEADTDVGLNAAVNQPKTARAQDVAGRRFREGGGRAGLAC